MHLKNKFQHHIKVVATNTLIPHIAIKQTKVLVSIEKQHTLDLTGFIIDAVSGEFEAEVTYFTISCLQQ